MMSTSEAVTRGIRVQVAARYAPDHSSPQTSLWFFVYTVRIVNESSETVRLLQRHWTVTDATSHVEEVKGAGVVGEQPTLAPGDEFEYTSGCPLATPYGSMAGSYQMMSESGERFDARIAPFELREPQALH